jgi:farnesyl diphosphate synthase
VSAGTTVSAAGTAASEAATAFHDWMRERLAQVEQALSAWVAADAPAGLGEAMRYAVLDGGKRLRPLLVLAAAEAARGHAQAAMRAACAVELIHAYSLVHDDMQAHRACEVRRGAGPAGG